MSRLKFNTWFGTIFYIIGLSIFALVGFLSCFDIKFFNSLGVDIFLAVLIVSMLVIATIQNYPRQKTLLGKILTIIYFDLFAVIYVMSFFVSNRIFEMLMFFDLIISLVILFIFYYKEMKEPDNYTTGDFIAFVTIAISLDLLYLVPRQNFVGGDYMFLSVLILALVLGAIAILVFFKVFERHYLFVVGRAKAGKEPATSKGKVKLVGVVFIIILCAFALSLLTINTINYSFDSSPQIIEAEIVDKDCNLEPVVSFKLKVLINGKEKNIEVSSTTFYSKEVGESLSVKLYNGALGYSYYIYEGEN